MMSPPSRYALYFLGTCTVSKQLLGPLLARGDLQLSFHGFCLDHKGKEVACFEKGPVSLYKIILHRQSRPHLQCFSSCHTVTLSVLSSRLPSPLKLFPELGKGEDTSNQSGKLLLPLLIHCLVQIEIFLTCLLTLFVTFFNKKLNVFIILLCIIIFYFLINLYFIFYFYNLHYFPICCNKYYHYYTNYIISCMYRYT